MNWADADASAQCARMDWTQVHLAFNHLPVVGIPLFLVVLLAGALRQRDEISRLALWALAVLSVLSIVMKFSGDFAAEQAATHLKAAQEFVTAHEGAGDQATTGAFLLAVFA